LERCQRLYGGGRPEVIYLFRRQFFIHCIRMLSMLKTCRMDCGLTLFHGGI
jgi:hypothetical protein